MHSIFMNSVIKQGGQMLDELIERGFKLTYKETALELHNKLRQSLKGKKYSQIKQIVILSNSLRKALLCDWKLTI